MTTCEIVACFSVLLNVALAGTLLWIDHDRDQMRGYIDRIEREHGQQ